MRVYDQDPDVVRWGLHHLVDVCTLCNDGSRRAVTKYGKDSSKVGYVSEVYLEPEQTGHVIEGYQEPMYTYIESDAVIARALQEEYSRVAAAEASGFSPLGQGSILAQDWQNPSMRHNSSGCDNDQIAAYDPINNRNKSDNSSNEEAGKADADSKQEAYDTRNRKHDEGNELHINSSSSSFGEKSRIPEDLLCSAEVTDDDSVIDGEVEKRLNQMVPIPHVPKTNGQIPTADEEISDHQRLLDRLQLYELVENTVQGDGNCQFRAISDQLYRTPDHHKDVREQVVKQLKSQPEMYDGYVLMSYGEYLKKMSKGGEWGDHVTLQAAADLFGVKIFMITSFKDTCYIEILPHVQKSKRVIFLSFWAEVHYNSIYTLEELPVLEGKKKKKWWMFGS
ncbi:OTU domain-containing protein [Cephalotus follicularis]|uniref:ubiquitinyl hydrolase 1 n=1 Tax=Cephalotus follicularis TaxID=3775 RepID=A0A1Q3B3Q9_CEPFO|nr:OTU domain-containing protein [Cephalotus follicularis]